MNLNSGEVKLFYNEQGNPKGLPIIFIHGFPFDHTMWGPQVAFLPEEYMSIVYDIRGIGRSEVGNGQYTIEMFADDLFALMDHLKLGQAVLCGLSMGGYVALRAAQKSPERIKALILCDTKSEADNNEVKLKRAQTVKNLHEKGMSALSGSLENLFSEKTKKSNKALIESLKARAEGMSAIGCAGATLAMAGRLDTTEVLPELNMPVLLLVGEDDKLTTPEVMEGLKAKLKNAQLHVIPDAGHLSNLENPQVFNRHLADFLVKVEQGNLVAR